MSAPPLGRPPRNQEPEIIQQRIQDERFRNAVEGKFGQAKRRFSLGRIMAKLFHTAESSIAIAFLVMNLELLLKQILFVFLGGDKNFSFLRLILFSNLTFSASPI